MKKKKICFVGELNSVHLQKWVNYFKNSNFFNVFVISASKVSAPDVPYTYYDEFVPGWFRRLPVIPKLTFLIKIVLFKRLLKKIKPDIIHVHQLGSFGVLFGLTNYHPMIVSTWGSDIIDDNPRTKLGKKKREVLLRADLITATSNFLLRETEKFIGETKKIEVVPFGVNVTQFNPKMYRNNHSDRVIIGFAKYLKPIYGVDILIQAFKKLSNKFDNVELVIAGEGEQELTLKTMVKDLGLEKKIKFVGWVRQEEMPKFLSGIDIFVMPTIVSESFGVAALEASAMELPVVASNIGGIQEVIKDRNTGILVEPKDVKGIARAIAKLVSNASLRNRIGKAGRKFVEENYSWQKSARKMEQLYLSLLEEEV